mmetsp:Transcript_17364/g.56904  ORF Transcript_17364/g.56904 Transcript_17364/m.56904 type:complete len:130 (+) Transcript_17364:17-406(+)
MLRILSVARAAPALGRCARPPARAMAGGGKPLVVPESPFDGPAEGSLARSEPIVEMGVRYEAGSPSPMESILSQEPIVVDGLLAVTGGGALGFPKQFIKLKPDDPTPVACTYSGLRFVSKQALKKAGKL